MAEHREQSSSDLWLGTTGLARIGISIDGYEFPDHKPKGTHDWDANWLSLYGRIECSLGSWDFIEPCLTTWEVSQLAEWLREFPSPSCDAISFTEPLLAFSVVRGSSETLSVQLRGEAIPSSMLDHDRRWGDGVVLSENVTPESVRRFAAGLSDHLRRLPLR